MKVKELIEKSDVARIDIVLNDNYDLLMHYVLAFRNRKNDVCVYHCEYVNRNLKDTELVLDSEIHTVAIQDSDTLLILI